LAYLDYIKIITCILQATYFNIASMLKAEVMVPPKLDAPGKGLPKFELFMARILVGWKAMRTSRLEAEAIFECEKVEILKLLRQTDPTEGRQQVLVKRLRGLEDSSRFWSIYMTADHLKIVNDRMNEAIRYLLGGSAPSRVVGTADVKPASSVDERIVEEFEKSCLAVQETVRGAADLKTALTWPHPWFGELNAERWHFFAGFHMGLHRKQMLLIQGQLPPAR
jgi:hypothetical protein